MTNAVSKSERLELRLFGTFEVQVAGLPLSSLRARKEQWLLALLALRHDRDVSRSWLASTLWPDNDETQALFYLRKTLSNLRQTLGEEAARLQSPSKSMVRFDLSDAFCDLVVFDTATAHPPLNSAQEERLHEALSLYRGPLLQECAEEWITVEREARLESYLAALESAAVRASTRGEVASACRWLRLALAAAPDRESAACALMQALAVSGDRAAVRQVYQELRLRLRESLSTSPSPETEALYKRLAQQEAQPAALPPAAPAPSGCHLPVPLTDLIGRERQIAEVGVGLERARLLTLMGPGGVGKTRLSIAAAEAALPRFEGGVWFVDLAPLTDGMYVPEVTARTLGVSQEPGQSTEERLIAELGTCSLLLVLDNCEHLLDASALLAGRLLSACPGLRILATSRQALGVTGEQTYPVPSLALPSSQEMEGRGGALAVEKNPAFLLEYAGIQLFAQRAVQANPAFRLDRRNAPAVVNICQQLDGIPLSIELAAARLRSLSVGDIQTRLADRFRLLNSGSRSALPRQQTLRAVLDWSYVLLPPPEQALLHRLSVFAGGWTLEAAEQVCVDEGAVAAWDVLDTLTALVEKNLVVYEPRGEPRYHLLETIRQYAHKKLAETGEAETYRRRRCERFVAFAEMAEPELGKAEQAIWLDRTETELDNLRQAISFCEKEGEDVQKGLRILGALNAFWWGRDHIKEARQYCTTLLSREVPPALTRTRAAALIIAGNLAFCQGDNTAAQRLFEESLAVRRHLGDRRGSIGAMGSLGNIAHSQGDIARARGIFEEALALCREFDTPNWQAVTLTCLGNVTFDQKDYAAARSYTEASLELCRKIGDRDTESATLSGLARIALQQSAPADAIRFYEQALGIERELVFASKEASTLGNLANAYAASGNIATAATFFRQSLSTYQEEGDQRPFAGTLEAVATFLAEHNPNASEPAACRLFGAAEKRREDTGSPRLPDEQERYDRVVSWLQRALNERTFSEAWAEGRTMTMSEAIASAIQETEAARVAIAAR